MPGHPWRGLRVKLSRIERRASGTLCVVCLPAHPAITQRIEREWLCDQPLSGPFQKQTTPLVLSYYALARLHELLGGILENPSENKVILGQSSRRKARGPQMKAVSYGGRKKPTKNSSVRLARARSGAAMEKTLRGHKGRAHLDSRRSVDLERSRKGAVR
jgi:hypothetical protein